MLTLDGDVDSGARSWRKMKRMKRKGTSSDAIPMRNLWSSCHGI